MHRVRVNGGDVRVADRKRQARSQTGGLILGLHRKLEAVRGLLGPVLKDMRLLVAIESGVDLDRGNGD